MATHIRATIKRGHVAVILNPSLSNIPLSQPHIMDRENKQTDRPATMIYTSGSLGAPKRVIHSTNNHIYSAKGLLEIIPFTQGDKWLVSLPFYHVSGLSLLWREEMGGGTLIYPQRDITLIQNIRDADISHISLVESQLYSLLKNPLNKDILKHMKAIIVGGGPLPLSLWQKAKEWELPVYTTYGLTEMASSTTLSSRTIIHEKSYHSGKTLNYRKIYIDADMSIFVKGKTLFMGFEEKEWFKTGDAGFFDADNNLHIIGRQDNMFISGGENIYPEEIEKNLLNIEGVDAAVVVATADIKYGHRPRAFIKTNKDLDSLRRSLPDQLANVLPKFKIPTDFHPWPKNYPNTHLKIDRPFFNNIDIIST